MLGWFEVGNKVVHVISSLLLSLVSRNSNDKRKEVKRRTRAWEKWWKEYGPTKGTFNLTFDLLDNRNRNEQEVLQDTAGTHDEHKSEEKATKSLGSRRKRKGLEVKRKTSIFDSYSEAGYAMFGKISDFQDSVRRRGLLEDFKFSVEVGISNIFAWFSRIIRKIFFLDTDHQSKSKRARRKAKKMLRDWERLHTYTAADAILRAGYPLEEHSVTTEDGYVLQMHRIPRRTSMDVVFFQHGVLDTSLGWVANGVGGSVAFTAFDEGFDVWLGNTRSNPPRVNVNPGVRGAKYWRWSANELAIMDLKAQFDYIHRVKMQELRKASFLDLQSLDRKELRNRQVALSHSKTMPNFEAASLQQNGIEWRDDIEEENLPYRLQAVGHSLGAACLLMYAVHCKLSNKDHRLKRLVLLSPAGFHPRIPWAIRPCKWVFPIFTKVFDKVRPQGGIGLRLPSWPLRWVTFKLMADVNRSPVLFDLFSAAFRGLTSGDSSEWTKAMSLPHYNANSMPAVSLHTANQFAQWANNPIFGMYDYGSMEKNLAVYGSPVPHSIAQHYDLINTLPIDLASGSSDGLIPPESVEMHLFWMKKGNVPVTIREFDYGHLEFIFGVGHELVTFIVSCLKKSSSLQIR